MTGLTIVADENIPALEDYFGDLLEGGGRLERVNGRTLGRDQLVRADILLVRSVTPVNEDLLADTPVRFVGSCTIGTDHLDTAWLERQGIAWSAAPGCNANSVVEYVFCALAALDIDWRGRSFGIVGCGNVGGLLQRRMRELEIPCVVYDPWLPDNPDAADLQTVLQQDVICLHAPLVKDGPHPSLHMIGAEQLARIKDGAVLISAGRGAVIDNAALLELLQKRKRFTTVLDVWENEPDIDTRLLELVDIGTPHIAGYSMDGKLAGTRMVRDALESSEIISSPLPRGQIGRIADLDAEGARAAGERHGWRESVGLGERERRRSRRNAELEFGAPRGSFADLLLQMYDPRNDDHRLRAAADGEIPMARAFDQLRREYPRRLEFSHFSLADDALDAAERRQLAILGLK